MINNLDRKAACQIDETNHGSWCWECFVGVWLNDLDEEEPDCENCVKTRRDPLPWCELMMGGQG